MVGYLFIYVCGHDLVNTVYLCQWKGYYGLMIKLITKFLIIGSDTIHIFFTCVID